MFHKIKDGANAWTCELLIQNQYYASRSLACPSERQQHESACLRLHISTSYIFLTLEYTVSQYSTLQLIICTREPTKSRNMLASRIWSQHNLKILNQRHIQNKTFTYDHDLSLYRLLTMCNGSWLVSTEKNVNSKVKPPAMLVFFGFSQKWPHVYWWIFFFHLRSLNVRHFEKDEGTSLKVMASMSPSMAHTPYWIS
jgi:hypothetical protein